MSDKPAEKPPSPPTPPINFNLQGSILQGSISFGDKPKDPPKESAKPTPKLTSKDLIGILTLLLLLTTIISLTQLQKPQPPPGGTPATGLNEYTILVGSFATNDQANVFAAELRSKNINNFTLQAGNKWLVCVGKFMSEERANRVKEDIVERGYEGATVLSPRKK
jgi:cell division septation protein DedD